MRNKIQALRQWLRTNSILIGFAIANIISFQLVDNNLVAFALVWLFMAIWAVLTLILAFARGVRIGLSEFEEEMTAQERQAWDEHMAENYPTRFSRFWLHVGAARELFQEARSGGYGQGSQG